MSVPNGIHAADQSPDPAQATSPTLKRKHDETQQGLHLANGTRSQPSVNHVNEAIRSIFSVLESHDIPDAILKHFSPDPSADEASSDEHAKKKPRLSSQVRKLTSITQKVQHGEYETLDDFVREVKTAISKALKEKQHEQTLSDQHYAQRWPSQTSSHVDSWSAKLFHLSKIVQELGAAETRRLQARSTDHKHNNQPKSEGEQDSNSVFETTRSDSPINNTRSRLVLSMLGSAQGHKQLFSSLQKTSTEDEDRKLEALIRQRRLPLGIQASRIDELSSNGTKRPSKLNLTFKDVWPHPSHLPRLPPPQTARPPSSHGNSITWIPNRSNSTTRRPAEYARERQRCGQWLGYNGISYAQEPSSPEAKRKRRDRALSTGETAIKPAESTKAAQRQAREDALFRSAYSGFAPCRDNTTGVIPDETKSDIWWERVGKDKFAQDFDFAAELDPEDDYPMSTDLTDRKQTEGAALQDDISPLDLVGDELESLDDDDLDILDDDEAFEAALDAYFPAEDDSDEFVTDASPYPSTVEGLLAEVADLLETLHSYQRIRYSSLSSSRPSSSSNHDQKEAPIGSPSAPSTAETATYRNLKSRLANIVSMVPPYAVSNVNGEQYGDMKISRRILIEAKDFLGPEDEAATRQARNAALTAAVGVARVQAGQSPAASGASQPHLQYSSPAGARTAQMTQQPLRQNSYGQQFSNTLQRQNSGLQRQPLANWNSTPSQSSYSNSQRPMYAAGSGYGRQSSYNTQTPGSSNVNGLGRPPLSAYSAAGARPGSSGQPNGLYSQTPSRPHYGQNSSYSNANYSSYSQTHSPIQNRSGSPQKPHGGLAAQQQHHHQSSNNNQQPHQFNNPATPRLNAMYTMQYGTAPPQANPSTAGAGAQAPTPAPAQAATANHSQPAAQPAQPAQSTPPTQAAQPMQSAQQALAQQIQQSSAAIKPPVNNYNGRFAPSQPGSQSASPAPPREASNSRSQENTPRPTTPASASGQAAQG